MENMNTSWGGVYNILPTPKLHHLGILIGIVALDVLGSVTVSKFMYNDSEHLRQYLRHDYEEYVEDYFSNNYYVMPDSEIGWVNAPNKNGKGWKWFTDEIGKRIPEQEYTNTTLIKDTYGSDNAVMIFGSSAIAGYGLNYNETLPPHLNNLGYESYNFGTIVYSIDQSYKLYKKIQGKLKSKYILASVHNDPEAMASMFNAFRSPKEKWSPFLKPTYQIVGNEINEIRHEPAMEAKKNHDLQGLLNYLKENDYNYYKFEQWKMLSYAPISDLLRQAISAIDLLFVFDHEAFTELSKIQLHFMDNFASLANQNNNEIIFIKFLIDEEINPAYKYFVDDRNTLNDQHLKQSGHNIIYLEEIFLKDGKDKSEYFLHDGLHLTDYGNDVLARAIDEKIKEIEQGKQLASN